MWSKDVNIFSFLSKKEETYNDLIKQIGKKAMKTGGVGAGLGPAPLGVGGQPCSAPPDPPGGLLQEPSAQLGRGVPDTAEQRTRRGPVERGGRGWTP